MNGYSPQDIIKESVAVGASVTEQQVSKDTGLYGRGAYEGFRVDFEVSGVTVSTGITAKLQGRSIDDWTDYSGANASVAITADGEYSVSQFALKAADQPNFPLPKQMRLVVTTGAGDAVTFDVMRISQEL